MSNLKDTGKRCKYCGDPIYTFQLIAHDGCAKLAERKKEVEMDLIIIKEENGKLIVDEDSLYKFPPCKVVGKSAFEVKVGSIKAIPPTTCPAPS